MYGSQLTGQTTLDAGYGNSERPRVESHLEARVSQARRLHAQLYALEQTLIRLIEKVNGPIPHNGGCEEKDQDPAQDQDSPGLLGQLYVVHDNCEKTFYRMMQAADHLHELL